MFREELDPDYDGPLTGGLAFCQPGTPFCDADYDYATRPQSVRDAIAKVDNTGDIGKPMITLHGTIDALLPIESISDPYRRLVEARGKTALHRYYVIENGNHVDGRFDVFPDRIKPLHPCWDAAFTALERWVEDDVAAPPDQFVADERGANADPANECAYESAGAPGAGPLGAPAQRVKPRGLRVRLARRADGRLRVRGRLLLPGSVARTQACGSGTVRVVRKRVPLDTRCRFAATVRAARSVRVGFSGNRALKPISARRRL